MRHAREDGMRANLSLVGPRANAVCVHLNKEKQSRDADTNNKEERLTANKLSCGSIHSVHELLVDVLVSFDMLQVIPHVVGLVAFCAECSCCQCTKLIHFLTCTRIPCRDSQCENGLVRCCLYTIVTLMPAPMVSLRTLAFFFPLISSTVTQADRSEGPLFFFPFFHFLDIFSFSSFFHVFSFFFFSFFLTGAPLGPPKPLPKHCCLLRKS